MKNKYFGDVNDYKKYGLLRLLTNLGRIKTVVCWSLTENDGTNDGKLTEYLGKPHIWENHDPIVYQHLKECVLERKIREVNAIQQSDVLPGFQFFDQIIHDDIQSRECYFTALKRVAEGADLVFFDPDNGIEVKSIPKGRTRSSKYIYWNEIEETYHSGQSLLIYQHFPRISRTLFIHDLIQKVYELDSTCSCFVFRTSNVMFLLISQRKHEAEFISNFGKIRENWGDLIQIEEHKLIL